MAIDFTPRNELERRLVAAQQGEIPPEAFVETLVGSEVYVPVCESPRGDGLKARGSAEPLKIPGEDGDEVLVLFTSPERASALAQDYPQCSGGLTTDFAWLLDKLGASCIVSLNPGDSLGLDFEAQDLVQIARAGRRH